MNYCLKSVQISFFWSLISPIQSEYGKTRTRKNSVFGHFSHSQYFKNVLSEVYQNATPFIIQKIVKSRFWCKTKIADVKLVFCHLTFRVAVILK